LPPGKAQASVKALGDLPAILGSGSGAGQNFLLDLRPDFLVSDFEIVRVVKIQPILRRGPEIPRQAHGSVHCNSPLPFDDGADSVHRNPQGAPEFVQADTNFNDFIS